MEGEMDESEQLGELGRGWGSVADRHKLRKQY
jgi:hypothetical protein